MGAIPLPPGSNAAETVRALRILNAEVFGTLNIGGVLLLPSKATTGDPYPPIETQIYINFFDNKIRVYADGQWRDLATW